MKRVITLWAALGVVYIAIEILWRGYTHPTMLIVGGLCGVLVGSLNQWRCFYNAPIIVQSLVGAFIVLLVEFISGCILNLWLGLGVWDYTGQPFNILGQVCPTYGALWFLLMPTAIWGEDTANWMIWVYDQRVHDKKAPVPEWDLYSLGQVYREFFTGK